MAPVIFGESRKSVRMTGEVRTVPTGSNEQGGLSNGLPKDGVPSLPELVPAGKGQNTFA